MLIVHHVFDIIVQNTVFKYTPYDVLVRPQFFIFSLTGDFEKNGVEGRNKNKNKSVKFVQSIHKIKIKVTQSPNFVFQLSPFC